MIRFIKEDVFKMITKEQMKKQIKKAKHNESQKRYYDKNKDKYIKYREDYDFKTYYQKHKDKIKEQSKNYKKRDDVKFKNKARKKAQTNIKIPKNKLCEVCNINKAVDRHHEDYNKPLNVLFVCRSCNKFLDRDKTILKGGLKE